MKDITPHNIQALIDLIAEAERPVIVTHAKPDGDAMGSSTAMLFFLMKTFGKTEAKLVLNDNSPRYLNFIKDSIPAEALLIRDEQKDRAIEAIGSADLIICLDFHAFHRTGALEAPLAESRARKILVDHHLDPDRSLYELSFSQNDISSASELLFWVLMATPQIAGKAENLPAESAIALMTGMTTDTNNFGNSVYPSTLNMASELLRIGVDRDFILHAPYDPVSLALSVLGIPKISESESGRRYNNARLMRWAIRIIGEEWFRELVYQQWCENRCDGKPRNTAAAFQAKLYAAKDAAANTNGGAR
jgi:phosphoesterase RecJ-like protein